MYRPGDLDHWTDAELVELWRERSAMRCCDPNSKDVAQANYLAGQEVRQWITRPMPLEIKDGMRKFGS